MNELEKRIRQLEIEKLGLQFQVSLLMDKLGVTLPEMKDFASKCLEELPDSEVNSAIHLYLQGLIQGDPNQK
ncbi:hypothetical protein [Isobaculum melis]|uniref:Uncharacterized protein n=1 Tax=Isobaculum melis TaxID=142588 RepID=A0A1H9PSI9_9LACT|nr:hypothetical protein [Isobaculum melis]SER50765.1 hypothetical protein SAMN04488559_10188 [Isobaculum melis]